MIKKSVKYKKRNYLLLGIPAFLILLCMVGGIYNAAATNREKIDYPQEGQLVEVFDTQMHVYSIGERMDDKPAIVLISGLGTPSPKADFYPIWSRLSEENYIVVLERPGYGWSQSTKRERTVQNITEEDWLALQQAGIDPPYVLVAHSIGGLEANMFAANYSDEVQGVVLLDCTSPEMMLSYKSSVTLFDRIVPVMRSIGLLRLIDVLNSDILVNQSSESRNDFTMLDEEHKILDKIFVLQKYQNSMILKEKEMRETNAEFAKEISFPSNVPVSMIVAVQPGDEEHPQYQEFMKAQEAWISQSENSHIYNIIGRHYIHHYAPEEVCDIIKLMVESK